MIIAMFLAHLVGDFILQWDDLAQWKSREIKGVLVHVSIVFLITWLFSLPFDPTWWRGVLFISCAHLLIDGTQFYFPLPVSPLLRLLIDQALHFTAITIALFMGGFLHPIDWPTQLSAILENEIVLVFLLGYAFLTMPAWVLLKYSAYAFVEGSAPKFLDGRTKYYGIIALFMGGFLHPIAWPTQLSAILENETVLVFLLGYAFLTMPAWVLLKYSAYAFVEGSAPKFLDGRTKYYGIIERLLITTFVITGQFLLIPLATLPRLILEKTKIADKRHSPIYLFELLVGFMLAIGIGFGLRGMST